LTRLLPPDERFDGSAADLLAFVHAERVAVEKVFAPYDVFMVWVYDPEVGVESLRDVAFAL
jgi:hypothetical protein